MVSDFDIQKGVDLIDNSSSVLITTHTRPDGDACGSVAAMSEVLKVLGKQVKTILLSQVPKWYEFLFAQKPPIFGEDVSLEGLKQGELIEPDLIIVLDTNSRPQLPRFEEYLRQNDKPVLIVDHHVTSDNLGDVELVDTAAAATGIIVYELFKYADWPITEAANRALFTAVATDTGWFQFSNTDSRTFRIAAELVDKGVEPSRAHQQLYQNFSPQRFRLMAAMLNTLQLHFDGRFASQHIALTDFERTGAFQKDTENLIDECRRIQTVEAAALFVEMDDGRIRCSLRSKGGIDVSKIAQKFGGGGHRMAAGTYLPGPLKNAKQLMIEEIRKRMT